MGCPEIQVASEWDNNTSNRCSWTFLAKYNVKLHTCKHKVGSACTHFSIKLVKDTTKQHEGLNQKLDNWFLHI